MITSVSWDATKTAALPGTGATMRHVAVKAGHVAQRHHHDYEQFFYVAAGHGRLECEAGSVALEPGTAVHLPAGAWHSAEFTADTVLIEANMAATPA